MNIIFPKIFAYATAVALLSFHSRVSVDATDVIINNSVQCSSNICVESATQYAPTQGSSGGYQWDFVFANGGLEVKVVIEENLTTCSVSNGNGQTCKTCGVCAGNPPSEIEFDCTNLRDGRSSNGQCESLNPFVYPFHLGAGDSNLASSAPSVPTTLSDLSSSARIFALGSFVLPLVMGFVGF